MRYTTNSGLRAIIRALGSYDINVDAILENEGISVPSNADIHEHISPHISEQLLELAIRETRDPAFPLKVAEHLSPLTFGDFSIGLLTSSSIRSFLQRVTKYYPYLSNIQRLRLVEIGDAAILLSFFAEHAIKRENQMLWTEVTLAFIVRFMKMVSPPGFHPARVELVRSKPDAADQRYLNFFGVVPDFDASRNALYFSSGDLDVPFPDANLEVSVEYEKKIVKKLAEFKQGNLPLQVHAFLLEELPRRPLSKVHVASHFAMSPKSFQNKLNEVGVSYKFLLDNARLELAELFLSSPEMSLEEVADKLGYSDASNFCRAYKRLTGHLPRSADR